VILPHLANEYRINLIPSSRSNPATRLTESMAAISPASPPEPRPPGPAFSSSRSRSARYRRRGRRPGGSSLPRPYRSTLRSSGLDDGEAVREIVRSTPVRTGSPPRGQHGNRKARDNQPEPPTAVFELPRTVNTRENPFRLRFPAGLALSVPLGDPAAHDRMQAGPNRQPRSACRPIAQRSAAVPATFPPAVARRADRRSGSTALRGTRTEPLPRCAHCGLPASRLLVDQQAQLAQEIDTEEGAPRAHRHYRIGRADIRPFDRQRAQPPLRVQI